MIGTKVIFLKELDSTNNYAAKLLNEGTLMSGTVILAEYQTQGRGQRGNEWVSKPGQCYASSYFIDTAFLSVQHLPFLNMALALAVLDFVKSALPAEECQLKWPNDVLVNDKKLAGILIEIQWKNQRPSSVIFGLGLNIKNTEIQRACSLEEFNFLVDILNIYQLLNPFLNERFEQLKNFGFGDIKKDYLHNLWRKDKVQVAKIKDEMINVIIRDVDENGDLLVETNNGVHSYALQEIQFIY